jgi:hypothetical protein
MGLRFSKQSRVVACVFAVLVCRPPYALPWDGQSEPQTETRELTAASLPKFLNDYSKTVGAVAEIFNQLEKENLPLLDPSGHALGRRTIKDRSKELLEVRGDIDRLAAKPDDLVLTMKFLARTERLADDVYDLSQIAYDNDREELGKRFTDLLSALDRDQDQIEAYALTLAAAKQHRIQVLEQENRQLRPQSRKSDHTDAGPQHPDRDSSRH